MAAMVSLIVTHCADGRVRTSTSPACARCRLPPHRPTAFWAAVIRCHPETGARQPDLRRSVVLLAAAKVKRYPTVDGR
jgi:hypothetical protein